MTKGLLDPDIRRALPLMKVLIDIDNIFGLCPNIINNSIAKKQLLEMLRVIVIAIMETKNELLIRQVRAFINDCVMNECKPVDEIYNFYFRDI